MRHGRSLSLQVNFASCLKYVSFQVKARVLCSCNKTLVCVNTYQPFNFVQKIRVYIYIQGVPGGMCHTSGECSLS